MWAFIRIVCFIGISAAAITPVVIAEENPPSFVQAVASVPVHVLSGGVVLDGRITDVGESPIVVVLGGGSNISFKDPVHGDVDLRLLKIGASSLVFDYRGVGDSARLLPETSLDTRLEDTLAAIQMVEKRFPEREVYLMGISMGADVAVRASEVTRVDGLILVAPMAYPEDVRSIPFGPDMKIVKSNRIAGLRSPEFNTLERFGGAILLAYPRLDDIVPHELLEKYHATVEKKRGDVLVLETTEHIFLRNPDEVHSKDAFYSWLSEKLSGKK